MAVDAVRYRSRDRRAAATAAKAKREKIILVVGAVVLLGLLAFEGPKTLKKLHGSSTPAPAAAPAATTGAAPAGASTPAHAAASVARLRRFSAKDPFVQQLGGSAAGATQTPAAAGPFVRTSHFVVKDPFVQQLLLAAPAPTVVVPAPASGSAQPAQTAGAGNGKYVVILASVPVTDGLQKAKEAASTARQAGVTHVAIVNSSTYPTLRTGFYAVYSGPYPTLGALMPALQSVRGQGYPSAYTRRLAH